MPTAEGFSEAFRGLIVACFAPGGGVGYDGSEYGSFGRKGFMRWNRGLIQVRLMYPLKHWASFAARQRRKSQKQCPLGINA